MLCRAQPGYEDRVAQPEVGPSQPHPSHSGPPTRQWSGTGWQYQPSQPGQYRQPQHVTAREWQQMQQGELNDQKPPDKDSQQGVRTGANNGSNR